MSGAPSGLLPWGAVSQGVSRKASFALGYLRSRRWRGETAATSAPTYQTSKGFTESLPTRLGSSVFNSARSLQFQIGPRIGRCIKGESSDYDCLFESRFAFKQLGLVRLVRQSFVKFEC